MLLSSGQDETEGEANRDRQISSSQGDSEFMTTVASTDDFDAETVSIGPPELVQMSNKSVMLMWSVPAEAEGRIQFFKIQYKMAKAKSGWVTLREQLPPHVRNHMVGNLMAGETLMTAYMHAYNVADSSQWFQTRNTHSELP